MAGIKRTRSLAPATNYYLVLYNTLSCLGWGYVLVTAYLHLTDIPLPEIFGSNPGGPSAFSFRTLIEHVRELVEELIRETKGLLSPSHNALVATIIPLQLLDVYNRMTTTYDVVGGTVAVVQTAAALEIVHSLVGLVKSPLPTVVIQVYSRLFLVWGITQKYEQVRWQFLIPTTHFSRVAFPVASQCTLLDHDPRLVHDRSNPLRLLRAFADSKYGPGRVGLPTVHHLLPSVPSRRRQ